MSVHSLIRRVIIAVALLEAGCGFGGGSQLERIDEEGSAAQRQGIDSAVEPLVSSLDDPDMYVRIHAAQALGSIGDKRAVPPLVNALDDTSGEVRYHIVQALGSIGDKRASGALATMLRDGEFRIREAAADALASIGWEPGTPEEQESYGLVQWEKRERAEIAVTSVEPLVKALASDDYRVRIRAARALDGMDWRPANEDQRIRYLLARGEAIPLESHSTPPPPPPGYVRGVADRQGEGSEKSDGAQTGRVKIQVRPKSDVLVVVDGVLIDRSRGGTFDLPAGAHEVEIIDPSYSRYSPPQVIDVRRNKGRKVTFDMKELFPEISNALVVHLAEEHFKGQNVKDIKVANIWRLSRTRCLASISYSYDLPAEYEFVQAHPVYLTDFPHTPRIPSNKLQPVLFLALEGFTPDERGWVIKSTYVTDR